MIQPGEAIVKPVDAGTAPASSVEGRALSRVIADYVVLTKPRVNILVVFTTLVGLLLAARDAGAALLVHTLLGTFLVASGAAAFNQIIEREVDARMRRTRHRPLPDARLSAAEAVTFAALLSLTGLVELALGANLLAAAVAFATLASYALVYTPLKQVTSLSTVVGAVPGALPPVIGWAAGRGELSLEAAVLFGIVFLWQMPHVLAVSWLYREDYERGGILVLPVLEPDGASTARQVVSYSTVLIPISLMPIAIGLGGLMYAAGAVVAGLSMLAASIAFARHRTPGRARHLFAISLLYLPVLWVLLLIDRA
jgi:protoheme IX farnesyltransferase